MGKLRYLSSASSEQIKPDLWELGIVARNLADHAMYVLAVSSDHGVVTTILKYLACFTAIYLLILDRTNWKTSTALLVPYICLSLPSMFFSILRGDIGRWIAFVAVVTRLFFPRHFRGWIEVPAALVILLVVAPNFIAHTIRDSWLGVFILLVIGCYLLYQHISASGGFRNSSTHTHGISNTIGIILLLVYPVWMLLLHLL